MTQTALLPPTDPDLVEPVAGKAKPGRFQGLRRTFAPVKQARGVPKALLWTGFGISTLFVLVAIFAPLIAPYDFDQYSSGGERFPKQGEPGGSHLFGTTVQNLDVLTRVIYGARTALEVMILAVIFSLVIGVVLGLLSGYFGGWLDRVLVLIMDALFAFPYLLLAIVAGFIFSGIIGGSVVTAALAITVVYIPQYFRVVRSSALSAREATYVEAARAMGAKPSVVIRKYLFSNVVQSVPVITTMNAADAISTLAGLGFLGMGIEPTEAAEWGYDLERAIDDVNAGMWWTALFPGLAVLFSILGFTLLGEGLNDVLNPTTRRRRITKVLIPSGLASRRVVVAGAATTPVAAEAAPGGARTPAEAQPATAGDSAADAPQNPADAQSPVVSEPAADAEGQAEPAAEAAGPATSESKPETAAQAPAESESAATSESESGTPAQAETLAESASSSETPVEAGTPAQAETPSASETPVEAGTPAQAKTPAGSETPVESASEPEAASESETPVESASASESESEPGAGAHARAGAETAATSESAAGAADSGSAAGGSGTASDASKEG
ncbi:ABC transporter permease [Wenjunlia tyrosinilytica]|uniref:ABC transmembrane type-1 domain-containing protein n=1 Tax=Wenjunlia tyrosinilytica TaxID=1544741 RepID=A0A917ZIX5_9ACTN|nr:ABC transporter permease [Wenjunlia tyrosinilytica]GGO82869.1 hypothetical protein GCM10012280_10530 [Wenjunlia tyrosinilytica]